MSAERGLLNLFMYLFLNRVQKTRCLGSSFSQQGPQFQRPPWSLSPKTHPWKRDEGDSVQIAQPSSLFLPQGLSGTGRERQHALKQRHLIHRLEHPLDEASLLYHRPPQTQTPVTILSLLSFLSNRINSALFPPHRYREEQQNHIFETIRQDCNGSNMYIIYMLIHERFQKPVQECQDDLDKGNEPIQQGFKCTSLVLSLQAGEGKCL